MDENKLDTDPRVTCTTCQHYRPLRCNNHKRAALWSAEISRALADLKQHCPGYAQKQ